MMENRNLAASIGTAQYDTTNRLYTDPKPYGAERTFLSHNSPSFMKRSIQMKEFHNSTASYSERLDAKSVSQVVLVVSL